MVAAEDVVRAQVDEASSRLGASLSDALHRPGVHGEGLVLLSLAHVDVVEGGAVDDENRLQLLEDQVDGGVVGDVEFGVRWRGHNPVSLPVADEDLQIRSQLSASAGDEYGTTCSSHRTEPNLSIRGANSLSNSIQRML